MAFAEVNGQRLYYESVGDGPPVVFSHGYLMDATMFAPQVAALSDSYRCVTWDERGHGQTEADGKPFSYWDSAADVLGLLDALGIESAVLAGMSQGGFLSMRAALLASERVRALVLIDTQAGCEAEDQIATYRMMWDMWWSQGSDSVAAAVAQIILGPGTPHEPWMDKWRVMSRDQMDPAFECLLSRDDLHARLPEITCPALIFHGTEDAAIPREKAETLCQKLSGCQGFVDVPGAGHASNLGGAGVVNQRLRPFLTAL